MNSKERTKIVKKLKFGEDFKKKGTLVYKLILFEDYIFLIGFYFDSSIEENSFFVQYFIQPLFVKFPTFVFSLGERIGGLWEENEIEKLQEELSAFSNNIPNNIDDVIRYIEANFNKLNNNYKNQALGYSYILKSELLYARNELKKAHLPNTKIHPTWQVEEFSNITLILNLLEKDNIGEIEKTLSNWQKETISSIGLK